MLSQHLDPDRHLLQTCGSLYTLFFTSQPVNDFESAKTSDIQAFASSFRRLLDGGVLTAPSQFEANFISAAHTPAILKKVADVYGRALAR